jgi:hypothetical protein
MATGKGLALGIPDRSTQYWFWLVIKNDARRSESFAGVARSVLGRGRHRSVLEGVTRGTLGRVAQVVRARP